jgi:hypothetical protein
MQPKRLFHISEKPNIKIFEPRPSPSYFERLKGDVVFAITDMLLHNYLLPRDCPRVTFYSNQDTAQADKEKFLGSSGSDYVVAIESRWYKVIKQTTLYCYEFPVDAFIELDREAGYYVSYDRVTPLAVRPIGDALGELLERNVEMRIMPTLWPLAEEVSKSSLQFSLIRMRNATR